jgi:CBS domain-containing protein
VRPDDLVSHAAHLMHDRRVKRLPVVDADGRLVGIISRTDVLSVFSRSGQDIRREITQDVLLQRFRTDPASFTVTVTEGIVTLAGRPETAQLGHDLVAAVRHLEGVVAVRDRLNYPAPAEYVPLSGPLF